MVKQIVDAPWNKLKAVMHYHKASFQSGEQAIVNPHCSEKIHLQSDRTSHHYSFLSKLFELKNQFFVQVFY